MIEIIKEQGNIKLDELSVKQIIGLLNFWAIPAIKKDNSSFGNFLERCYRSTPWCENAIILYINKDGKTVTDIGHGFYDLSESEEKSIIEAIKSKIG